MAADKNIGGTIFPVVIVGDPNTGVPIPTNFPWINRSGTIAAGGTSQQLMVANAARRGFFVQNQSVEDLFIMETSAATLGQPSIRIPPGATFISPPGSSPVQVMNIVGATTGSAYAARDW